MKSILFRSIGISLFLLCLTFSTFADGEMGTGSLSDNGNKGGIKTDTTIELTTKTDTTKTVTETDFFGWLAGIFADVLG